MPGTTLSMDTATSLQRCRDLQVVDLYSKNMDDVTLFCLLHTLSFFLNLKQLCLRGSTLFLSPKLAGRLLFRTTANNKNPLASWIKSLCEKQWQDKFVFVFSELMASQENCLEELNVAAKLSEKALIVLAKAAEHSTALKAFECHTNVPSSNNYDVVRFQVAVNRTGRKLLQNGDSRAVSEQEWIQAIIRTRDDTESDENIRRSTVFHYLHTIPT